MAKGYWIARVDVADPERYKAYIAANAVPFKNFGARFLVRAGRFENPEGSSRPRSHLRVLFQQDFYLAQFNPEPAYLHLEIYSPN
jgi:uncharacterized protein (DUF1330 family)